MQRALELEEKRNREEQDHADHLARLDVMLADERQRIRDQQLSEERSRAIKQKEQDLATARQVTVVSQSSTPLAREGSAEGEAQPLQQPGQASRGPQGPSVESAAEGSPDPQQTRGSEWELKQESPARQDWEQQKRMENVSNRAIDSIMEMVGLEEVKTQILIIKARIDASIRQSSDMGQERWNVVFMGNPGTGMLYCIKWI